MQFTADHEAFRQAARGVLEREVTPHADEWERAGIFPAHELFKALGTAGLLGLEYGPAYGGQGADHSYTVVLGEELGRMGCAGVAMAIAVQNDMATPSLHSHGSEELKQRYLAPAMRGELVAAIAVTEPDAGSDVAGLRTRAERDGDDWVINGSKLYITNGTQADWLCLLARTSGEGGYRGMSQIVFPTSAPGFSVSRKLRKLGNKSSDTAELSFTDARVPVRNTIGEIGRGFQQQMTQFQNERMIAAYMAVGGMERALALTAAYLRDRHTFGAPLLSRQYVQFRLAELAADLDTLKHYNYACAEAYLAGQDTTRFATIAKLKAGRLHREIADTCLQFHGGFGYMEESWVSRYFRDSRLMSIGGGSDEVMLSILARLDGLAAEPMPAPILPTAVDPGDAAFQANAGGMLGLLGEIGGLLRQASLGGGERAIARHRGRGKLLIRERIALLLDPDSPFLEISPLAGYQTNYNVGGGMVLGIGVVEGTECVIIGNDPTDLGGAMTMVSIRKLMRALEIARDNRLPYIQFVESAGGDLRGGGSGEDPDAAMRRNLTHFAESGRMFHDITELSARGIPTVSVVFGSSTAGGAYQPGLADYNIFVRGGAKVFLGGPPLVKVATGEDSGDEELGGAQMHATDSGLADYLAEDEHHAIAMARDVVAHLHWRKQGPGPVTAAPEPPRHDPGELLGLMPLDLRAAVDAREVIARVVDGSRFEEFKMRYGQTLVTGWAQVHGFPVGILANNGVLFSDSSQKAAQFIQLCNQTGTPLVFLQHITGYMVGRDYERGGIVKHGSQMINALSNSTVPHVTVILGASYGAGNYGMGGRAFDTRFVFLWPTAKIAIMGPKQMAGVMSIVRRERAARRGEEVSEETEAAITAAVEHYAEAGSLALYATGRVADDGIIDPRDTRTVLAMALSACHSGPVQGARGYGVFRL